MKLRKKSSNENIIILRKELSDIQYTILIFGYLFFLMFIWPIISQSYLFIPFGVCVIPMIFPEFVSDEIIKNITVSRVLVYTGLTITTFLYTYFFLDSSIIVKLLHYVVYYAFGYIYLKKFE